MNIVVCLKQTFDTEAKISLGSDGNIDGGSANLIINPYDEFAVEEALKLKEKFGGEVTLISVGGERAQESLRTALAMGCDQAVHIHDPELSGADEWAVAEVLSKAMSKVPHDIILAGRIAVDDGSSQVAVRLAEALNIPSVTSILKLEIDDGVATVTREIDGGTELIQVGLPVLVTAQKGLNTPRYPSMMGIMKAKKKEIQVLTLTDLEINPADLPKKFSISKLSLPGPRTAGKKLTGEAAETTRELARWLREDAKVM